MGKFKPPTAKNRLCRMLGGIIKQSALQTYQEDKCLIDQMFTFNKSPKLANQLKISTFN